MPPHPAVEQRWRLRLVPVLIELPGLDVGAHGFRMDAARKLRVVRITDIGRRALAARLCCAAIAASVSRSGDQTGSVEVASAGMVVVAVSASSALRCGPAAWRSAAHPRALSAGGC
jgi:hypothetical protein